MNVSCPLKINFLKFNIVYYIKQYILSPRNVKEETLKILFHPILNI